MSDWQLDEIVEKMSWQKVSADGVLFMLAHATYLAARKLAATASFNGLCTASSVLLYARDNVNRVMWEREQAGQGEDTK